MSQSSRQQYHRQSIRIARFNYSQPGYYFVTICTKNREEYFGSVETAKTILSEIGEVAERCLKEISNHFQNVELDEYTIMPNHVHGIIIIRDSSRVGNAELRSLQEDRTKMVLPKVVHGYKSSVTRTLGKMGIEFAWQKSYYEHIIRNEPSLNRIREYIQNNPLQWELDIENPKCVKLDKRYYERIF